MDPTVPFNSPFIVGKELYNIAQAVLVHQHLAGNGEFTRLCQRWIQDHLNVTKALLTQSCTAALEMAALLVDIQPGDEVIMPSYTFVSTANAFVLRGAMPVFIDIRADTLNMDEKAIEQAVTDKTKAIVPVHYAGVPCAMDLIMAIAERHRLAVIEDAAHALLAEDRGRALGSIGHLGCISFHETKNVIAGEGGALLINDDRLHDRADIIWEKGTNRKQFFDGRVDKYTWVDIGSSYLPSELTAAFLYAQLERAGEINAHRHELCRLYAAALRETASEFGFRISADNGVPVGNGHLFYMITRSPEERRELLKYLNSHQVKAVFHYIPLHSAPAGRKFGRCAGPMTVTEQTSATIVRLPVYYDLKPSHVREICQLIRTFYQQFKP